MNKPEALAQLEALGNYLHSQGSVSKEGFREIIAALSSCACKGREPIDECGAEIYDVRGGTARGSAYIKVYGEDLKVGQVLHCLVFLPAEGETP